MPDLRKTLGDLYGSSPTPPPATSRAQGEVSGPILDDDLAEALSAALGSAPGSTGFDEPPAEDTAPAQSAAPTHQIAAPGPAVAPAGPNRARMAGTLREFNRDASKLRQMPGAAPGPATGPAGATAAPAPAQPAAPAAVEPLPGVLWSREQDNILPSGGATPAARGIHLSRRRAK
jgi:hypothetical protein